MSEVNEAVEAKTQVEEGEIQVGEVSEELSEKLHKDFDPVHGMEPTTLEGVEELPESSKRFPGKRQNKQRHVTGRVSLHQMPNEGKGRFLYHLKVNDEKVEEFSSYEPAKRRCRAIALEQDLAFDVKCDYYRDEKGAEKAEPSKDIE